MQPSCPSEPAQASQLCWSVARFEPDNVVTVSSSDTEEALEILSLSLGHGASSRPLR
jgi:hypothetical protein